MTRETKHNGKWAQPGVPHKGWSCIDIEKLDEQNHLCEMCEVRLVRFVHIMTHPNYSERLAVGCICAGHMEEDYARARLREDEFRRLQSRRQRWLSRKWRGQGDDIQSLKTRGGFQVSVFPQGAIWSGRIEHLDSGYARGSRLPYASSDAVKLAAFDAIAFLKRRAPWQHNRRG